MKLASFAAVSAFLPGAFALEPLAPLGFQTAQQAALPSEVHISYDVPSFGLISELNEMKKASDADKNLYARAYEAGAKSSFLSKGIFSGKAHGSADVYFEAEPHATAYESSYQSLLASMQRAVDADAAQIRAAVSNRSSFLSLPQRDPQVNIEVSASKGKLVDVDRLRADLMAYAKNKVAGIEDEILRRA